MGLVWLGTSARPVRALAMGSLGATLLGRAAPVAAGEPPLPAEIRWEAPGGCPDRERVVEALHRHVAPDATTLTSVQVLAWVEATDDGYRLHVSISSEQGKTDRVMESGDCAVLAEATAFMTAVAMDPIVKSLESKSRRPPGETAPPPPTPRPSPRPEPSPEPARRAERPRGFVLVEGGVSIGVLPRTAGTLRIAGGVVLPNARFGAGALHILAQDDPLELQLFPGAQVRLQLWTSEVHGCAVSHLGPVELPVCAAIELGAMLGRSQGIAQSRDDAQPWVAIAAGSGLQWAPSRWFAFGASVDAVVVALRPTFAIDGVGRVYRAPRAFARAQALVEARFP